MRILSELKRYVWENFRCSRHNWLHLKLFRVSYKGGSWTVRDRHGIELRFPFYPYLALFEIEGYLRQGEWRLLPGMTVIDVGGCLGEFALYAARCVGPTGRVLMLEPDASNRARAQQLFDFNGGCTTLDVLAAGLWNAQGTQSFAAGLGHLGMFVEAGALSPPAATLLDVQVHSMASLASEFGLSSVDFVKMDIEGSELTALEGIGAFLQRFSPRFAIASYHPTATGTTSQALEPAFRAFGYAAVTGFKDHLTTWAWPGNEPTVDSDSNQ